MAEWNAQHRAAVAQPQELRIGPLDILPNIVLPNQHNQVTNLLDFMAGDMLVLLILSDPRSPACTTQLRRFAEHFEALQRRANFFVVTGTPPEVNASLARGALPFYMLSDIRGELAGAIRRGRGPTAPAGPQGETGVTVLIANERMRILRVDHDLSDPDYVRFALRFLDEVPRSAPRHLAGFAPLLHVPEVLEPAFCDSLINAHLTQGSHQSKAPTLVGGELRQVASAAKVRRDHKVTDQQTLAAIMERITKRVQPEIVKAFTRQVSGVEEYKVVCYEASDGGHFKAHRDNTMAHFAHRRFAMTIHLNTGDYEGGLLRFPEYGPDLYGPPKGDAVIYSSSLLHEVTPVTSGRRFVLIAHMFDEESRQQSPMFRR